MRVAIVGSREFKCPHPDITKKGGGQKYTTRCMCEELEINKKLREYVQSLPDGTILVTGGAPGVDRQAEVLARSRQLSVQVFVPSWKKFGKAAGIIRNQFIIDSADEIKIFWNGESRGSLNSIERAKKSGKPYEVILPDRLNKCS